MKKTRNIEAEQVELVSFQLDSPKRLEPQKYNSATMSPWEQHPLVWTLLLSEKNSKLVISS